MIYYQFIKLDQCLNQQIGITNIKTLIRRKFNACQHQTGNALFLILIAVALFAALSYALTQSGRGSGSISKETASLKAARMTQYAGSLTLAVNRMVIFGTAPQDIVLHDGGGNWIPCETGENCIFASEGGQATVVELQSDPDIDHFGNIWNYFQPSDNIRIDGVGTEANDMVLARHISYTEAGRQLCQAFNNGLGIDGIPTDSFWTNAASGKTIACVAQSTDYYVFYNVFYPL